MAARIELDDVSLCYRLAKHRIGSFKEYAIHLVRGSLKYEQLWAMRDVSFAVEDREAVGIVGHNGAGKSTLLKVVSRILKPTSGRITVRGRVAPILELGTGFDIELTGRENIFLNALLLGRTRKEIARELDAIVAFSGLDEFIDAPLRNYSSGMTARLGFSIATAWQPEILILDEVLSVGDASFAARCAERMATLRAQGATILLVSHSLGDIREMCSRAIWLHHGRLMLDGPVEATLQAYRESQSQ
jgi:ABC-type polysaccharide/polyol phosphate transport system ATPase subunit